MEITPEMHDFLEGQRELCHKLGHDFNYTVRAWQSSTGKEYLEIDVKIDDTWVLMDDIHPNGMYSNIRGMHVGVRCGDYDNCLVVTGDLVDLYYQSLADRRNMGYE